MHKEARFVSADWGMQAFITSHHLNNFGTRYCPTLCLGGLAGGRSTCGNGLLYTGMRRFGAFGAPLSASWSPFLRKPWDCTADEGLGPGVDSCEPGTRGRRGEAASKGASEGVVSS